jgi:hypothetical protein
MPTVFGSDVWTMRSMTSVKWKPGVGGPACVCCTKGPPRKWKPKLRRLERRKAKQSRHEES